MISSNLKAPELSPRASLPFSWNSDGDSGIATGGPTGATAFQAHLKSAQSAQSLETCSSPVADAPQKAETAESADPSSRVSLPIPSSHLPARPSIKPIRKASLNLRAMVDAKVRFIGPSTASISTPSGTSSVPSAQAGPPPWGEPFGQAERLEPDTRRPASLNSGFSPRNDVLQGLPERPLLDSRRLPEAEAVILRDKRGDSQDVPSSKQLSGDVFSAPSDAGLTYASRRVTQRPNLASSSESNFEIQRDFASGREDASGRGESPAAVSTNSGGGESTSTPQTIAAIGARVGAVQNLVNGSLRAAGTAETVQSLPTSRSATASQPSMGNDPIASEVREAARRAVAESQILGTSQVAVASVRPANNNDAFRSLILDPGIETLPSLTTDLAPPFGERLSDKALRPNSGIPSASSLSSFLPVASTPSPTPEPNSGEPSASSQREIAANRVPNPTGVQRNVATTAPTPSITQVESGSQNGAFIQREARSVNPSSELIEKAPANTPSETVQNEVPNPTRVQRNLATTTSTPSIISIESGSQNGAFIQREARSVNPSSVLTENAPTIEAEGLNAASPSSVIDSPSKPKPSAQSLRPVNRSPRAKGTDSVASNISARPSLEADKSSPTPWVLENGAEDRMRLDTLGRDAGSGSSSHPGPGHSQTPGTPVTGLYPGVSQAPSFQEPLVDGASNLSKTADAGTSASLLHDSHKSGDVRLVHLDSPGAGGLELRIQEVGEKLIIRTQDLVGSIDGQSAQWKELQQRLETSGIVLMPIEASLGATAAPIESRSSSEESRHTICYDSPMGSTGRDSSDPRSSSGRARSFGEPSHLASPEPPDETTESAEVTPASRQWWA